MNNSKCTLPQGIYGITGERFSKGRTNIEVVEAMIAGGVTTVQYREKRHQKNYRDILDECYRIREITRDNNVLFIVNDYVDVAMLVDADGVHVGQEDLSVEAVRKLVGPHKIIGLSTHSPEQAMQAAECGADYIGVGPIYATQTKEDVCAPVGLEYLEYVVKNCTMPFVAIGGIKEYNINEVTKRGAKTICLVTEIVGSDNIRETVESLRSCMVNKSR